MRTAIVKVLTVPCVSWPACPPTDAGGSQYRALIISNDEYNGVEELAIWALVVARDVPHPNQLAVRLGPADPLSGAFVKVHGVVEILDRTALRDSHGFVSHATMNEVEDALREFLELP